MSNHALAQANRQANPQTSIDQQCQFMKSSDLSLVTAHHAAISPTSELRDAVSTTDVISTHVLFGHKREIFLEHAGVQYRLRITQNNKLILTK